MEKQNVKIGRIKYVSDKGYGFIKCDDKDYFFHAKLNRMIDFATIKPGCMVEFIAEENEKGPTAARMIVVNDLGSSDREL